MKRLNVLLVAPSFETSFYAAARSCLDHFNVHIPKAKYTSLLQMVQATKALKITAVVTCDDSLLSLLLAYIGRKTTKANCNKWAGARFEVGGIVFVITRPFSHISKTTTGRWIFTRHVYKCLAPTYVVPEMNLNVVVAGTPAEDFFRQCMEASLLTSVDIETLVSPTTVEKVAEVAAANNISPKGIAALCQNSTKPVYGIPIIDVIGYTTILLHDGKLTSQTFVLHMNSVAQLELVRWANRTQAPKTLQNGGYDSTYFIRYGIPLYNYRFDTFHAMHSWFSELPRTLDFIASIFLPNFEYWKDLMDLEGDYYNGLDTYTTAWCSVIIMLMWPDWAEQNFHIEFRKLFPNVCMGLEGAKVDLVERERLRQEYTLQRDEALARLHRMLGWELNPSSPVQVKQLMNTLARPYVFDSSDEKSLSKWAERHPLFGRIVDAILDYRGAAKALSTYIETLLFEDRLLYELNAGGTTTGRSASKASNLWVGSQIQNQDTSLRTMYIADEGYTNCSIDGSQAESRTTAYLSQDEKLIDSVENAKDFHSRNASLFFGVPEDEIVKPVWTTSIIDGVELQVPLLDANGKQVKDKTLRDLSKRVNHGANYNMAGYMLLTTMGKKNVLKAQRILRLPAKWRLIDVANHLLGLFDATYTRLRGEWYDELIREVRTTGLLKLPNGWTRRCFGTPGRDKSQKKVLNELVSHKPQSLSVMLVDEGLFDFWLARQIKARQVRVKAQVHDEVIFQAKPEVIWDEAKILSELLMRPIEVEGRVLVIPNNGGTVDERWSNLKD